MADVGLTPRVGGEPAGGPGAHAVRFFLADLHLDGQPTPHAMTFRALLARLGEEAQRRPVELYILGDLFEFWEEYHPQVAARYADDLRALEAAHQAGVQIALLSGNRDFAYGRYVEERLGARLLGDGAALEIGDTRRVWLEHGDLLCTRDTRYLAYRRWVRSAPVRFLYRLLPWSLARRVIERFAERSRSERKKKAPELFEPNLRLAQWRLEWARCQVLMCGHLHRPQAHDLPGGRRLLVLPPFCCGPAGYREFRGALAPVSFREDGTPVEGEFPPRPPPTA